MRAVAVRLTPFALLLFSAVGSVMPHPTGAASHSTRSTMGIITFG
jgi:hypothetical protein